MRAIIIAKRPNNVIAIVSRVTPIDSVDNSVNVATTPPESRYPRTNKTIPGIPRGRVGDVIESST